MSEKKLKEVIQQNFEAIVGVFNPETKEWLVLSAADVGTREEPKHEILQVKGKKFEYIYELLGFKPAEGKVTWVTLGKNSRTRIIEILCEDIQSLVEKGKTTWDLREVKEEIPTILPEGVESAAFELYADTDAETTETVFMGIMSGKYDFRSAVNLGAMVRTVMYETGAKAGTPIEIVTVSKEMAWSLQQTIDWAHEKLIEVVAVRREGKIVEVAYIKVGIAPPPPKEKLIYTFKKTDGWTLVGEEKPSRR